RAPPPAGDPARAHRDAWPRRDRAAGRRGPPAASGRAEAARRTHAVVLRPRARHAARAPGGGPPPRRRSDGRDIQPHRDDLVAAAVVPAERPALAGTGREPD